MADTLTAADLLSTVAGATITPGMAAHLDAARADLDAYATRRRVAAPGLRVRAARTDLALALDYYGTGPRADAAARRLAVACHAAGVTV